jgi:transposase
MVLMPKFKPDDYHQAVMVAINYQDRLQPSALGYSQRDLTVSILDLSISLSGYRNDYAGRPAYYPAVLLKIILFAYSMGITSARGIQWCCVHNTIFKAQSCDSAPRWSGCYGR